MNLNGNKKDYLNRTKIWGIEDQGAKYVPLYKIELFVKLTHQMILTYFYNKE